MQKMQNNNKKCRVKIRLNPSGAASRAWECLYVVRSLVGHVVGHGSQCYKLLMRRSTNIYSLINPSVLLSLCVT